MVSAILSLLAAPVAALIATAALVPKSVANAAADKMRRWVTMLTVFQLLAAVVAMSVYSLRLLAGSSVGEAIESPAWMNSIGVSIYLDGVSCLMFLMVSGIGWTICRYSIRYLDGDPSQGNYFRWTGFTLGAVSLMVVSGNLVLFFAAWLMTSLGLHQLLLHNPERPAARRAAWTKFTVSRIGDGALAIAFIMMYTELGTLQLSGLFDAVASMGPSSVNLQVAALFLVTAAAIKSAQFPFHTWLPQTLETPTPVSALMHAGIVNAGGYLIVRTSPVLSVAPWALSTLAIVGAITACFGAIVMLTQTSIKKSLAYSTIAQMGFMMLQCGLGAFSAALLHILAHSMYKAHAFLSSGSVIADRSSLSITRSFRGQSDSGTASTGIDWKAGSIAAAFSVCCLLISLFLVGINPADKPGGLLLGAVVCLALTHWLCLVHASGDRSLVLRAATITGLLCFAYAGTLGIVIGFTAASVPVVTIPVTSYAVVAAIVTVGFGLMYWVERGVQPADLSSRKSRWYIHASNGFYVESFLRRLVGSLANS